MKKRILIKSVAITLILSLGFQIIYPNRALALTSGPSQPEAQSFEPVGTTDMVDLFSGDFVYNIPLLDVEGYPINISYHSGLNVEQEASWVGLGWNINPGAVNRSVRGLPDDFNGDDLEKTTHINPEINWSFGNLASIEFFGAGNLHAGMIVSHSNYRGLSTGFTTGIGVSLYGFVSAGVNMSINSQTGADIDYDASVGYATSREISRDFSAGATLNASGGYNSRTGMKDINLTVGAKYQAEFSGKRIGGNGTVYSTTIPIGLQNYVPVITNSSTLTGFNFSLGMGGELFGMYLYGDMDFNYSTLAYDSDGTRKSYGYMYLQNANFVEGKDILDFTREKDGMFNETMRYLPPAATTYDVYSASAQGAGGIFRPMRNDNGTVYDPAMMSGSASFGFGLEMGFGNVFETGLNFVMNTSTMIAGPWNHVPFQKKQLGSILENVYFKQAGELSESNQGYYDQIHDVHAFRVNPDNIYSSLPPVKDGTTLQRDARGNLVYYLTGREASISEMSFSMKDLQNYTDAEGLKNGPSATRTLISRTNGTTRKDDRLSEIIQVNKNGSRYVYGLPVWNNVQQESIFSLEGATPNSDGTVYHNATNEDNFANDKGVDHYYSRTVTPGYANSFLLTDVLSTDYVDVTGDGPSDDDLGTYTKFNYSRKSDDYRWKVPYGASTAQFMPGFNCDTKDDKASYIAGSKEQWYLHSIETKNFVAEFYTSARKDAKGAEGKLFTTSSEYSTGAYSGEPYNNDVSHGNRAVSYKLDSIKLYNKHDRFINQDNAVPIKTIYFEYNYQLCGNTPNSDATTGDGEGSVNGGKLTLQKIYMKYGNSDKNLLSPYQFTYNGFNPSYNAAAKDRWGNYKPNDAAVPNYDYPYVDQNADNDQYASAWTLNKISLPSGGLISVDYESDDYGYVQDRKAMEMVNVEGVGPLPAYFPNPIMLYFSGLFPYSYVYFKRRPTQEIGSDMRFNYLGDATTIYYNFKVDIANRGTGEFVRGYADVEDIGICPNDNNYAYIKLKSKNPQGTSLNLSPMVYTAFNIGRYYLPQYFYPGNDPNQSTFKNIIQGLAAALGELFHIGKNPIEGFVKKYKSHVYIQKQSFIRLCSPRLTKKGGGSRVRSIKIDDSWSALSGGDNTSQEFGNTYDYTTTYVGRTISSGVASYEPANGGDENPFRMPASYIARNGNSFPPNDPLELYQEEPIGESFYPAPTVGYSKVTVTNIHKDKARSAQTQDEYCFYTAKDFPIKVESTGMLPSREKKKSFAKTIVTFQAQQGYSVIMNDMHGKLKSIKNFVFRGDQRESVTEQNYIYNQDGNSLSSTVNVADYDNHFRRFFQRSATLGKDVDVTVDSRSKQEFYMNFYVQTNVNAFLLGIIPIVVPTAFFPLTFRINNFQSMVTTKIVQQYGILKAVETIKEGARYYKENQIYNRETGDVLLTKDNNEYQDPVYDMSYPAYWAYRGMGPAYRNILYEDSVRKSSFPFDVIAAIEGKHGILPFERGDELLCEMKLPSGTYHFKLWVLFDMKYNTLAANVRYHSAIPSVVLDAINNHTYFTAKVIRSGYRNMLNDPMQENTSLDAPPIGTQDYFKTNKTLASTVTTYSDTLVKMLPWHGRAYYPDTMSRLDTNMYIWGYAGNYRVSQKMTYLANRDYSAGHIRYDGTFPVTTNFWMMNPSTHYPNAFYSDDKNSSPAMVNPAVLANAITVPWKPVQTVTAYNMWGNEIEDQDALKVSSAALFGFNNTKPTAVASNANNYEILSENFEDYRLLYLQSWMYDRSPFLAAFPFATVPAGLAPYKYRDLNGNVNTYCQLSSTAHTGKYSLKVDGNTSIFDIYTTPLANSILNKFCMKKSKKYVVSTWVHSPNNSNPYITLLQYDNTNTQVPNTSVVLTAKSNVIDGWVLYEGTVNVTDNTNKVSLYLSAGNNYDDIRIYPADGNMKAFVYDSWNQKLIATLDENNFATMYQYDDEGQLIRINKETERGILTVQESRNANVKK